MKTIFLIYHNKSDVNSSRVDEYFLLMENVGEVLRSFPTLAKCLIGFLCVGNYKTFKLYHWLKKQLRHRVALVNKKIAMLLGRINFA